MFACVTQGKVNVGVHDVTDLLKGVLSGPAAALCTSWDAVRVLLAPLMAELDADAHVPRFIPNSYFAGMYLSNVVV